MSIREVEYRRIDGESLLLDVRPAAGGARGPAVVVVHGGGWCEGNRRDDLPFMGALAAAGLVVFSIEYRLAPKHRWPAGIEDLRAAIEWVTAHADRHNADAVRLGLIGYSAGGHLACHAAVIDRAANLATVALLAAPTDHVLDCLRRGGLSPSLKNLLGRDQTDAETVDLLWRISPINHLAPGLPPFLHVSATADQSVPHMQAIHLHERMLRLGVQSELLTINGATHRIGEWDRYRPGYAAEVAAWMAQRLATKNRRS